MKTAVLLLALLAGLAAPDSRAGAQEALELHVKAGAPAPGDGSAAHPYAGPAQALAALAARSPEQRSRPARVLLHGGTYALAAPLRMGAGESGSAAAPVAWQAAGDGEVVFSGGLAVAPAAIHPVTDRATLDRLPAREDGGALGLFEIRLAELGQAAFPPLLPRGFGAGMPAAWPELFQDGRPLPLSAWPNGTGYAGGFKPARIFSAGTTAKVVAGGAGSTENKAQKADMVFAVGGERVKRWKRGMDDFHAQVWFGGHWFWDWADDFLPAASIGEGGVVTMAKRHGYGMGPYVNLHVYNLAEEMDLAGEYALEPAQNRLLVLLPKAGIPHGLVLGWLGEPLVAMDKAAHVRFEGIRFAHGRSDGVRVADGDDIAFRHCAFGDLGVNGLSAKGGRISAQDCRFTHIGATGAQLSGGDMKTLTHAGNRVAHCTFRDFGRLKRTYAPAVKLDGVGGAVEHCLMEDAPHSAVLYGGQEHLIRDNEIRHVLTETGDCGAIYAGRDWTAVGTVISGNWIHDLKGVPGRWPCGIYLDDQLSGVTVQGNLIERAPLGILVGGGRYDVVTGNILRDCPEALHLDSRGTQDWTAKMQVTLHERLAKVPADKAPWKSRYPMLKDMLKDRPQLPVGTRISGNALVDCAKPWHACAPSGVAQVAPNWEKLPAGALREEGQTVKVAGTPLVFVKPQAGVLE